MKVFFDEEELEQYVATGKSKKYRKYAQDKRFTQALQRAIGVFQAVAWTSELVEYSFLHYEKLKHYDLSSIRILPRRVERLLFREMEDGVEVVIIELDDTHYGNKK